MAGNEPSNTLELTVGEAPESDVGLGRARIDDAACRLLGVGMEDVLEVVGKRQTVAVVHHLGAEDESKAVIRIDGLVRENAKVSPGETVIIRKASVSPAKEVELAPVILQGHKISFGQGTGNFVKRGLLKRPLRKGDVVIAPGIRLVGGAFPFMVLHTKPEGNVKVNEETTVTLREEPFRKSESLSPEERLREFVDRVAERLSSSLAEFEEELATLSGETGQKAQDLTHKVRKWLEELRRDEHP